MSLISGLNVTPITEATKTPDDQVREAVDDGAPMIDAIDRAMRYALEAALCEDNSVVVPAENFEQLHHLVTLAARGAVFRALREERERVAADQLSTPPTHPISQNAFIREVIKFNMIAGRTMDEFDPRAIALHTAFQLEELGEKLELGLLKPQERLMMNTDVFTLINTLTNMKYLGALLKAGRLDYLFEKGDPVELLDGDIDVMVVSIGSMMSQGADIFGACHAVSGANLAKYPGGVCIKDKDGKIQKPDGWQPADLTPFLHISKRFIQGNLGKPFEEKGGCGCAPEGDGTDAKCPDPETGKLLCERAPATVTGTDGVVRPNPAAGAPKPENWNPVG